MEKEIDFAEIFDGDLEKYYYWNIENAAKRIAESLRFNQGEEEIYRMVYNIHKEILENNGFDKDRLKEGDKKLEELIKQNKQKLNCEWN